MTKNEFATVIAFIESNYHNFKISDNRLAMNTWFDCLKDLDFKVTQAALKKQAMTSEFPPTIAAIRKNASDIQNPQLTTPTEAWEEVTTALRRYGSWNTQEALDSFTEITRRAVDSFGWDRLCQTENMDVVRGQFLKMYGSLVERKTQDRLLSPELLELTQNIVKGID